MGRITEGIGVYIELRPSNMFEVSFAGARQRTRGCSPRGLGGDFVLVQGLKNIVPLGSFAGMAVQCLFQLASALFQPASAFSVLVKRPGVQLNHQESARQQRRVWLDTWSFTIDSCHLIRGCGLNRGVRGAPEPRPV